MGEPYGLLMRRAVRPSFGAGFLQHKFKLISNILRCSKVVLRHKGRSHMKEQLAFVGILGCMLNLMLFGLIFVLNL